MTTIAYPLPLRSRTFTALVALVVAAVVFLSACTSAGTQDTGQNMPTETVTDALGRKVKVPQDVNRILMAGQKLLYTTALLNPDNPTDKIAAWPEDLKENDLATYKRYSKKFPTISTIPTTGEIYNNTMSLEQALESRPDVFVVNAGVFDAAKDAGIIDGLEKAGVPTVAVDYFIDPVKNTVPSIRLIGKLLNREDKAEEFITYYESKVSTVTSRLKKAKAKRTPTFLWRAPRILRLLLHFRQIQPRANCQSGRRGQPGLQPS